MTDSTSKNQSSTNNSSQASIAQLVAAVADTLMQHGWMLTTAESCTGGLIAGHCTDLAGSSQWFERGFVTYSNEAKHDMLGVEKAILTEHGAVSEPTAQAMALVHCAIRARKSPLPSQVLLDRRAAPKTNPSAPCGLHGAYRATPAPP